MYSPLLNYALRTISVTFAAMLEALLKPLKPDRFFAEYWPDRTYASHGKLARLPSLFQSEVLRDFSALARNYRGRLLITRGRNSPYMV
jgi:hypothetical protein